jgi:hypothetical protein
VKIVYQWPVRPRRRAQADVGHDRRQIALRGFEVAEVSGRAGHRFEITANRPDCLNHVGIARRRRSSGTRR